MLIEEISELSISVETGQLVEFEEGVVVGIEGVLSKQLGIVALQLLEGPHRNQELIGLLNCRVITALLIYLVFEFVGWSLILLRNTEIFVFGYAGKIEIQKV